MASTDTAVGCNVVHMRTFEPDTIRAIFTRLDVLHAKEINARFTVSQLGDLSLIRSVHSTRNSYSRRLQRHMSEKDRQYYFACLPLKGTLQIKHLGRSCQVGAGSLCFVVSDEEYVIAMSDRLDALWLRVPAELLRSHAVSIDAMLGCPLSISNNIGFSSMGLMRASIQEGNKLTTRGAHLVGQALVGFLGELVNSTLYDQGERPTLHRSKILARARDFIEQHLDDENLSPRSIAEGIGISIRYLSQIFAAEGTSAMRWVQRRRLERTWMQLQGDGIGQRLIQDVVYSTGFTNVSSFNRAFKAHFGQSPRKLMRAGRGTDSIGEKGT